MRLSLELIQLHSVKIVHMSHLAGSESGHNKHISDYTLLCRQPCILQLLNQRKDFEHKEKKKKKDKRMKNKQAKKEDKKSQLTFRYCTIFKTEPDNDLSNLV